MRWVVGGVLVLIGAGCGGGTSAPDAGECRPGAAVLLPGPFDDPAAFPLPDDCVEGGMRDALGRWFFSHPTLYGTYGYPRFELDCNGDVARTGDILDEDLSDGFAHASWTDGTRFITSDLRRTTNGYESMDAFATCMRPDGTLAGVFGHSYDDTQWFADVLTGRPFGPRGAPAAGVRLVGEIGQSSIGGPIGAFNLWIDGTHAYIAGYAGLDVVDVADPAHPVAVGHVDGNYNDVRVVRGAGRVVAFAASATTDLIDVTDPAAPVAIAQLGTYSHSLQIRADGGSTFLYLATYTSEVPVYDVTDPTVPVLVGLVPVPPGEYTDGVHDLTADATMLYVNASNDGMVALDVSAGLDAPVDRGRFTSGYSHASAVATIGTQRVILHGDEGGTGDPDLMAFLQILDGDVASPTFLTPIGRYQSRPEVGIHYFELVGNLAYIAYYQDGLRIVDLTNPAQPIEVGHFDTWGFDTAFGGPFEGAFSVRVVGAQIYVVDPLRGLLILERE